MADIQITLRLQGTEVVVDSIKRLDDEVAKLGTGATTTGKAGGFLGDTFQKLVPAFTVAQLAADGVQKSFRFLKDQIGDSIAASIDAERVDRALESALKIVGQAAGGTADKVKGLASALQRKTTYDDEAIKSAQALIIQLRGTASQIDVVTKGAIGLASVLGLDLQTAARNVALGFEGNYIQLSRMIPAIRNATTEGEKHTAMMEFLDGAYQRAESDAGTFGGKLTNLKNVYNELQESIGDFITKNEKVIATLSGVKEIIIWLDRNVSKADPQKSLASKIFGLTAPGALLTAVKGIGDAAKAANEKFEQSFEGMTLAMFEFRKAALDPIPIIIREKLILPLTESQLALAEEVRWLRMLGGVDIIPPVINKFGTLGDMVGGVTGAVIDFKETVPGMFEGIVKGSPKAARSVERITEALEKSLIAIQKYRETAGAALGALDAVIAQGTANRMISLDNEYNKRLAYINASITDEDKRQQAIAALDDEFSKKRRAAQKALALSNKAVAISSAIISTHEAAAKAMAQGGFILGIPWAAIIEALGWIQVGLIAAQPIPLAQGGVFKQRTRLMSERGLTYDVAEIEPEAIASKTLIRQAVREELGGRARGVQIMPGALAVTIYAQTLDDAAIDRAKFRLLKGVNDALRLSGAGRL